MNDTLYPPSVLCQVLSIKETTYESWKKQGYLEPVTNRTGTSWRRFTSIEIFRVSVFAELVLLGVSLPVAHEAAVDFEIGFAAPRIGPEPNWWFVSLFTEAPRVLPLLAHQVPVPNPDGTMIVILNLDTMQAEKTPVVTASTAEPSSREYIFIPLSHVVERTRERLAEIAED